MNYLRAELMVEPAIPGHDLAIHHLSEAGWEGFEERDDKLLAYIPENKFNENTLKELAALPGIEVSWSLDKVQEENWNALWESHFEPIEVRDKCRVRAPFHESQEGWPLEVVIEPQMSFGTGHHDTTWLMIDEMLEMDTLKEPLLDMGCGTGILAIIAEMLGVKSIEAIDVDKWAIENTAHNASLNQCVNIGVEKGDVALLKGRSYGSIFANINKNVLLKDLETYSSCLLEGGDILLSGFFVTDEEVLKKRANEVGLRFVGSRNRNNWAMLRFAKKGSE